MGKPSLPTLAANFSGCYSRVHVDKRFIIQTGMRARGFLLASCDSNSNTRAVSGTIETDEVHVASRYGGRVEAIFAWEGDSLTNGQLIAQLDSAELRARRDQVAAQLAELVAGPRKEEIEAARRDWEAQLADLDYATAEARRVEELLPSKAISQSQRDQAVTHAQALEKSAAAAKSRYDLLLAGTRPEQVDRARAQLAELDAQMLEMRIVAPSNSVLEVLSVKVGDVLAANQQVATLLLPQYLWVRVYVPETWLAHIKLGDPADIRVDGFPGKHFSGVVQQIAREAEFTPRNVQTVEERIKQVFAVKVLLDNSSNELRAGMSADVIFPAVP